MKRWLIMLAGVLVLILIIGGIKACDLKKMGEEYAAMGEPTSTVSTVKVAYDDWAPALSAVGSTRAVRGVELAVESAGLVHSVNFSSGDSVRKGDVLIQLVTDSDEARLKSLQADAALAKIIGERSVKQLEAQAISQAQADADVAKLRSADAAVAEQQALIQKKTIVAPFGGELGISTVNPGQYLNPGDKVVTLQQLDPIHIDFTVPQAVLAQIRSGLDVKVTADSFPGLSFPGQITAVNPVVDTSTRNVRVQATVRNAERKLLPGMFTNITVSTGKSQRYLTLPQNAVAFNPYGETVFVVVKRGEENAPDPNKPEELLHSEKLKKLDAELKAKADAKSNGKSAAEAAPQAATSQSPPQMVARQVFIKTGPSRGDQVAVLSGLKEGEEVVTSGQIKLKNGTLIVINNEIQPSSNPDPRPVDE